MILSLSILVIGVVVLTPLTLWSRQRERELSEEGERTLARLRRRRLALTTRMGEIAHDVETLYPTPPPTDRPEGR